jgi:hypothetical protein
MSAIRSRRAFRSDLVCVYVGMPPNRKSATPESKVR